jgi:hypothetical protein
LAVTRAPPDRRRVTEPVVGRRQKKDARRVVNVHIVFAATGAFGSGKGARFETAARCGSTS